MTSQASGSVGSCAIRSASSVPLKRPSASSTPRVWHLLGRGSIASAPRALSGHLALVMPTQVPRSTVVAFAGLQSDK